MRIQRRVARIAGAWLLATALLSARPSSSLAWCAGDCNADGTVSISELIRAVNLALGRGALGECAAADSNGDEQVRITDLIAAVNAALAGCPPEPTATPTAAATPTATASPTINLPPQIAVTSVYRSFPGEEVAIPLAATDPEGGSVSCEANDLPAGAAFDAESATLTWMPSGEQIGAYGVDLACTDGGGATGQALLPLRIAPLDACTTATCEPATGCTTELLAPDQDCCDGEPEVRVPEPAADCPAGRLLRIGRNERGFGRIDNCHYLRLLNSGQGIGAHILFNIEARCIDIDGAVRLATRLETDTRILTDSAQFLDAVVERGDGFFEQRGVFVPLPTTDRRLVEGHEALLTVRLTDADRVVVEHRVRVVLTSSTLPDLAELD